MPIFGDFETVGEPIAVTEYRHHTTTVWRARKLGSGADPTLAIKCFAPLRAGAGQDQDEETLAKDHALEFLEGVKHLKKAHAEGGRCLCPVHAFGFTDAGPWFVTDFYPRNTLKAWIARRGSMDGPALAQVVRSVCSAGLSLKRARGYSHGNLKPSNIFLVGKPRPLRQTPLELGDVYPAGAAPMTRLEGEENRDAKELLGKAMEAQDLRALGELLLQLVEGRLVSSAYDYNYPIAHSPAWDRLGRHADRWRELCNRLLDPQLSLGEVNFESLLREFQPSGFAVHRTKILAGAGAVCVIVVGIYLGMQMVERGRVRREKARAEKFVTLIAESKAALEQNDFAAALTKSAEALRLKPDAPEAAALKAQVEQKFETAYQHEISGARQGLAAERFDDAERAANRALQLRPADKLASDLMKEAQTRRNNLLTKAQQDRNYEAAINAANIAVAGEDFTTALTEINRALGYRANDADALRLKVMAEKGQQAARDKAESERNYRLALDTGRAAVEQKDYDKAKREAERALGYKANDAAAQALLAAAEAGLKAAREQAELERKYQQATNAAGVALAKDDFATALTEANRALALRTNDVAAANLKLAAELGQKQAKAQAELERNYQDALTAARSALRNKDYDKAKSNVERALGLRAKDAVALELKTKIEAEEKAARTQAEQDRNYQQAITAAQAAGAEKDYDRMLSEANRALGFRANDKPALDLKAQAERGQQAVRQQAELDQNYRLALAAAEQALEQADYSKAITEANRALHYRPNDATANRLIANAGAKQEAQKQKAQREENYRQAMTLGSNAWARADLAFEKMNYNQALQEITNTLKQFQVARANGDSTAVEPLEKQLKKRQADIQREQEDENQFVGLLKTVKLALQTNNLALAEERLAPVQELARTNGLSGREYAIRAGRDVSVRSFEKEFRDAQDRLRISIVALVEAERPDYQKALALAKTSKAFADLAARIKTEQPVWDKYDAQFAQGKYDFIDALAGSGLAQKLPFKQLLTLGQSEMKLLEAIKKAQVEIQAAGTTKASNEKWQRLRDELKAVPAAVKQKPSFQELNRWAAENDPVNAFQYELDLYKVWFKVGNYRRDLMYQGQKAEPMQGNITRQNQEAYVNRVLFIKQAFKDAGLSTPERENDLDALKQAIELWNR